MLKYIYFLVTGLFFIECSEVIILHKKKINGVIPVIEYKDKYISILNSNYVSILDNHYDEVILEENKNILIQNESVQYVGRNLWNLDIIDNYMNGIYSYYYTGKNVSVYVIDSGITNNEEFEDRLKNGTSFSPYGSSTNDCLGHGTHVASIIGSKTYGIAKNVNIIPVKIFDCSIFSYIMTVIRAIYWVIKQPKGIVNLSIGGEYNSILNEAIKDLTDDGFIVVVAAGNNGKDSCLYSPSSEKSAITVGCFGISGKVCDYSNEGKCVTLFAPGDKIVGLDKDGKNILKSGTSMSTSHVSGIAATIYEKYPDIKQRDMKQILKLISLNSTILGLRIPLSPNLSARRFKNVSVPNCRKIRNINICNNTDLCEFFPKYGCREFSFCRFRTKKECLLRKRCTYKVRKCELI